MRARILFLTSCGVVAVVAGWIGWMRYRDRLANEAQRAVAQAQTAKLTTVLATLRRQAEQAQREQEVLSRARADLQAGGTRWYRVATDGAKAVAGTEPKSRAEVETSEARAAALAVRWQNGFHLLEYGSFYRARGYSPEKIAQLAALENRMTETITDVASANMQEDATGQKVVKDLRREAYRDYQAARRELLGEDEDRAFREYEATIPARKAVLDGFAGSAALQGAPLTTAQGEALVSAVLAAQRTPQKDPFAALRTVDWAAMDAQARAILSPAQFELFRSVDPLPLKSGVPSRWQLQLEAVARSAREAEGKAGAGR